MQQLSRIKPNSQISLKLKTISRYYHPFLNQFTAIVVSSSENEVIIQSPIKNSSEKQWTLFSNEIESIQEIVDVNEKIDTN